MSQELKNVFKDIYKKKNCDWTAVKAEIESAFSTVQKESSKEITPKEPNQTPKEMKQEIKESEKLNKLISLVEQYTGKKIVLK